MFANERFQLEGAKHLTQPNATHFEWIYAKRNANIAKIRLNTLVSQSIFELSLEFNIFTFLWQHLIIANI